MLRATQPDSDEAGALAAKVCALAIHPLATAQSPATVACMHPSVRGRAHRAGIVALLAVLGVGALPALDSCRVVEVEVRGLREAFGRAPRLAVGDGGLEHQPRRGRIACPQRCPPLSKAITAGRNHAVIIARRSDHRSACVEGSMNRVGSAS